MSNKPAQPIQPPMDLKELGKVLAKHYGLTEGRYEVLVEFAIGFGAIGPTPEDRTPGAMIGLKRIGLVKTEKNGPLIINAAEMD